MSALLDGVSHEELADISATCGIAEIVNPSRESEDGVRLDDEETVAELARLLSPNRR